MYLPTINLSTFSAGLDSSKMTDNRFSNLKACSGEILGNNIYLEIISFGHILEVLESSLLSPLFYPFQLRFTGTRRKKKNRT